MMELLLRYRRWALVGILLLTVLFGWGISLLTINFSFDDFFPRNDPEFEFYDAYRKQFSEEQTYMAYVALKSPSEDVFNPEFLESVDTLLRQIARWEGIDSMTFAMTVPHIRRRATSFSTEPYLQYDTEEALTKSRDRVLKDSAMVGVLLSRDLQYLCAYLFVSPEIFDTAERDKLITRLESALEDTGYAFQISGIPQIRTAYIRKIGEELKVFLTLANILIVLVLFLMYRNIWGILIPTLAVLISLVWILGFMGITRQPINLISNLLIPIIFVVGISDVVHLMTKYLHELRTGLPPVQAMKISLKEIGFAIFLTSLTTAIGFASLAVSRVPPIRSFGLYAAIGVAFTYLVSIVILPNLVMRVPAHKLLRSKALDSGPFWTRAMLYVHQLTRKKGKAITLIFAGTIIACCFLIFRIPTDTFLLEDIGPEDPIRKEMEFFEKNAFGMRPFDLSIVAKKDYQITDREILVEMDKIQEYLSDKGQFSPFISAASFIKTANYHYHYNRERHRRIPDKQTDIDEILDLASIGGGDFTKQLYDASAKKGRIGSTLPDIGTEAFEQMRLGMENYIQQNCDTTLFSYRVTGHAYLTEKNLTYLRKSLLGGLAVAFVVIGLIMGLLFRSWKMLMISLVPNMVPLILTGGVMGLFDITLTASTAIVFVIAFGIAVDDTIHFLTRFRLEQRLGHSVETAIRNTLIGTGKAMLITSLVLIGGFVTLLTSDFGGTFSTGLFTGLTVLFALLADLFLLPILLRYFFSEKGESR